MELIVMDTNFTPIHVVDSYESFIWKERYCGCGDFELYTSVTEELLKYIRKDYYISIRESDYTMIVESITIKSDPEEGNHIQVTGRTLESILDRRIIWGTQMYRGSFKHRICTILTDAIVEPKAFVSGNGDTMDLKDRKIDNFVIDDKDIPDIEGSDEDTQYTGDSLYDVVVSMCTKYKLGFRILLNDNDQFVFSVYEGKDRSYEQDIVQPVVFSPSFDNFSNGNYIESVADVRNVALIAGKDTQSVLEGIIDNITGEEIPNPNSRIHAVADANPDTPSSGLSRREIYVDAQQAPSESDDGTKLNDDEYVNMLKEKGSEELQKHSEISSFEGEAENTEQYTYGVDFFKGDVVSISDEYGHQATARITEMVISDGTGGLTMYPTFETIKEEGEDA